MRRLVRSWLAALPICATMQIGLFYLLGFAHWSDPVFWKATALFVLVLSIPVTFCICESIDIIRYWVKTARRANRATNRFQTKYRVKH